MYKFSSNKRVTINSYSRYFLFVISAAVGKFILLTLFTGSVLAETKSGSGKEKVPAKSLATISPTPIPPKYKLELIQSGIDRPVQFASVRGALNKTYVASQNGAIFPLNTQAAPSAQLTPILDIKDYLLMQQEGGLLGFTFDPSFASNLYLYVHYTGKKQKALMNRVARFKIETTAADENAASQEIMLEFQQESPANIGGQITFDDSGMLLVGIGDGGGDLDPYGRGQSVTDLFGSILRLDVSGTKAVAPTDNPFSTDEDGRREIFAYGFRNPSTLVFDKSSKQLFVGDAGTGYMQEIDRVISKGNYGWSLRDGTECRQLPFECKNNRQFKEPEFSYTKEKGTSVVVGCVYAMTKESDPLYQLDNGLIAADRVSGTIWKLTKGTSGSMTSEVILESGRQISAISQNVDGDLIFADYKSGEILKLARSE